MFPRRTITARLRAREVQGALLSRAGDLGGLRPPRAAGGLGGRKPPKCVDNEFYALPPVDGTLW